ncbi:MAG: c-type cytochrome [Candidatus Brachytrichaceae bacterium NZ_4S206]|jgi:mono/diheme cytochrome c family protein
MMRSIASKLCVLVATAVAMFIGVDAASAASPAQLDGGSAVFDNLIFVVIGGVLMALLASVAGGVVIAVLANSVSRFFRRNLPTDEEMAELRTEFREVDQRRPRQIRLEIGPSAEPFVFSAIGFVACLIIFSLALSAVPQPVRGEAMPHGEEAKPAESAALPKEGDFGKITDGLPEGDPENGAKLFNTAGCVGCHSQKKGERLVGPSFYNLWNIAETRVPGMSAREYLYQSIVDPNAYIVEGYQAGLMQQNYAAILSPQQMADILAWIEARHKDEP